MNQDYGDASGVTGAFGLGAGLPNAQAAVLTRPRSRARSVEDSLFENGAEFDFFQAVGLLEQIYPDRKKIGSINEFGKPPAVKFAAHSTSMSFAASAIHEIQPQTTETPIARMTVGFMGLTGPAGILPAHYTELMRRIEFETRGPQKYALRDWFDLFNDRLVSLFYCSWKKYRPYAFFHDELFEPTHRDHDHGLTTVLQSCFGVGLPSLSRQIRPFVPAAPSLLPVGRCISGSEAEADTEDVVGLGQQQNPTNQSEMTGAPCQDPRPATPFSPQRLALLKYSGLLAQRPRSAANLQAILEDYLGLSIEVEQFHGNWLAIDEEAQTQLGVLGGNCTLAKNVVVGNQTWEHQNKILIRVGPVTRQQFSELMPDYRSPTGKNQFTLLSELVRLFIGPDLDVDIELTLARPEIPDCQLVPEPSGGLQLGWNTWLPTDDGDGSPTAELSLHPIVGDTLFCDVG